MARHRIKTNKEIIKGIVKDIFGVSGISLWLSINRESAPKNNPGMADRIKNILNFFSSVFFCGCIQFVILYSMFLVSGDYFSYLFFAIPVATLYLVLSRIRGLTEHYSEQDTTTPFARSITPNFLEKWLVSPFNQNYHLEHHLFPYVPIHNLGVLHKAIQKSSYAPIPEKSYIGFFLKLLFKEPILQR